MKRIVFFVIIMSVLFFQNVFALTGAEETIVTRLSEYLSLEYNERDVIRAYDEFYSSAYKNVLQKYQAISNAQDYLASEPEIDFEFTVTIKKVKSVIIKNDIAYIVAETSVRDIARNTQYDMRQQFRMQRENDKWVYVFTQ